MKRLNFIAILFLLAWSLFACGDAQPENTAAPYTATPRPTFTPTRQATSPPVVTPAPTSTPTDIPKPTPTAQQARYEPLFEAAECEFGVHTDYPVECGWLVVPEDRSQPQSASIRLHVAIFRSQSPDPAPDPVIHLVGGPGGSLLDAHDFYLRNGGSDILENRDYVMFNQRGTRYAEPSLECPGQEEFALDLGQQPLNLQEREAQEREFLLNCQETLVERGVDLAAYNSAENAADVDDLRLALGYDQVNLYGISYGTRLALTVMRDYPASIRSVILDSVYPPQVSINEEIAWSADRAFNTLFAGCQADELCRGQYPNLRETFYRVVDELGQNPITVPVRGGTVDAWVDGGVFLDAIFGSLYRVDAIPWLPLMISEADKGNFEPMQTPLSARLDASGISRGMHYSLQCREEVAFETHEDALATAANLPPPLSEYFASPFIFALCASWQSGQADPIENQPVASDIPTLVVSGQYDPITPPDWGRLAAETLSNSYFYEFPGIGHGVVRSNACGRAIALQFLADPAVEPDTSCLDEMTGPDFR